MYKVKNVHPGTSLRLSMQSTCRTQNPNSMNLSLTHHLAWWETRIQAEQRAVDYVTSHTDTFHPSSQPFSVCWLVLRPAHFEVSSSYQQELKTVASLFTFDRFFYLGVLTHSCAALAWAGFCPPIPTLAVLWVASKKLADQKQLKQPQPLIPCLEEGVASSRVWRGLESRWSWGRSAGFTVSSRSQTPPVSSVTQNANVFHLSCTKPHDITTQHPSIRRKDLGRE